MAGTSVSLNPVGLDRVEQLVTRLLNPDFNPLLDAIGGLVVSQTETRITQTKTAPDGTAWPALSPNYAKHKKKGGGILELEGDLRDSLVHLVTGAATLEVGSNLIYAATHQFGDMEKRKIPARTYLGLSAEDEQQINGLLDEWWSQQLSAA
jgi:phage virion morphogenesis protein